MNLRMDLIKKKDELLAERTACEQAKQDAHNRIIEINKTLKKLENLIAEADEILGEGFYPQPSEETLKTAIPRRLDPALTNYNPTDS